MLTITVPGMEMFDEVTAKFVPIPAVDLELEHSLVSLSKWEQKFRRPFLGPGERTAEETFGYVQAMVLTPEIPPEVFARLSEENFEMINAYVNDPMTATWINDPPGPARSSEIITAELIYYWMTAFQIDLAWERRHLSQLFTLIKVCGAKQAPPKKMGRAEVLARQKALNEQRRAQFATKG